MTTIDVSALVPLLGEPTLIPVERRGPSTFDDAGNQIPDPAPTIRNRQLVVHPGDPKTLERLGLDLTSDWRVFYDTEPFQTGDTGGPSDVVQYEGNRWEILRLEDYITIGGICIGYGKRLE